jgi:hypothetical protein
MVISIVGTFLAWTFWESAILLWFGSDLLDNFTFARAGQKVTGRPIWYSREYRIAVGVVVALIGCYTCLQALDPPAVLWRGPGLLAHAGLFLHCAFAIVVLSWSVLDVSDTKPRKTGFFLIVRIGLSGSRPRVGQIRTLNLGFGLFPFLVSFGRSAFQ